jgi:hypothetical protein
MPAVDYEHIKLLLGLHDDGFASRQKQPCWHAAPLAGELLLGHQVKDILEAAGAGDCNWQPLMRMAAALDGDADPVLWVYTQPTGRNRESFGGEGVRSESLVAALIVLERFGFHVDPQPLIDALHPLNGQLVNKARRTILNYPHERKYTFQLTSTRPPETPPFERVIEANGHEITIHALGSEVKITNKAQKSN